MDISRRLLAISGDTVYGLRSTVYRLRSTNSSGVLVAVRLIRSHATTTFPSIYPPRVSSYGVNRARHGVRMCDSLQFRTLQVCFRENREFSPSLYRCMHTLRSLSLYRST